MKKNSAPNPKATKNRPKFQIPRQLFSQLNEFCGGGFCVLMMNEEGAPIVFSKYDNSTIALGLRRFGLEYFKSVDTLNKEMIMEAVMPNFASEESEDFGEDDEDEDDDGPENPDEPPEEPPAQGEKVPV